jgi:hypothetical protein
MQNWTDRIQRMDMQRKSKEANEIAPLDDIKRDEHAKCKRFSRSSQETYYMTLNYKR